MQQTLAMLQTTYRQVHRACHPKSFPSPPPLPPNPTETPSCPALNQCPFAPPVGWWLEATVLAGVAASVCNLQALQPSCTLPVRNTSQQFQYACLMTWCLLLLQSSQSSNTHSHLQGCPASRPLLCTGLRTAEGLYFKGNVQCRTCCSTCL